MSTDTQDRVLIFDTTLRDGEQSPGAAMTQPEKLRIARALEKLRVDVIEAELITTAELVVPDVTLGELLVSGDFAGRTGRLRGDRRRSFDQRNAECSQSFDPRTDHDRRTDRRRIDRRGGRLDRRHASVQRVGRLVRTGFGPHLF